MDGITWQEPYEIKINVLLGSPFIIFILHTELKMKHFWKMYQGKNVKKYFYFFFLNVTVPDEEPGQWALNSCSQNWLELAAGNSFFQEYLILTKNALILDLQSQKAWYVYIYISRNRKCKVQMCIFSHLGITQLYLAPQCK